MLSNYQPASAPWCASAPEVVLTAVTVDADVFSNCFLHLVALFFMRSFCFLLVCHCVSAAPPSSRVCQVAHVRN